jgi:dienelactone hydrolase
MSHPQLAPQVTEVRIPIEGVFLAGDLALSDAAAGLVIFAHGSGSSRSSPRNRAVAERFRDEGLGTLLFDLLTEEEERLEYYTRHLRFDISLLARRLIAVTKWVEAQPALADWPLGYFGASTGAAAALVAAAELGDRISAVVSRGGRPDLAGAALEKVVSPTLLVVGGNDTPVIEFNDQASARLNCVKRTAIIPGATHLFEEPGALDEVSRFAYEWFLDHFKRKIAS